MKIEVIDGYNSVDPFVWDNVPSLSIITGLNGAGKSQLLELIHGKPEIVKTDDGISYKIEDITFWNSEGGRFPNSSKFQIFDLVAFAAKLTEHTNPLKTILKLNSQGLPHFRTDEQQLTQVLKQLSVDITKREDEIIKLIEDSSGKPFINLAFEEIMYHFPEHLFLDSDNIAKDRIEMLFYMYHYRKSVDEKAGKDMTDYPTPPWDLLNQVFIIMSIIFRLSRAYLIVLHN